MIGYPLFIALFPVSFTGMGIWVLELFSGRFDLGTAIVKQQAILRIVLTSSLFFLVLISLFLPLRYFVFGGE